MERRHARRLHHVCNEIGDCDEGIALGRRKISILRGKQPSINNITLNQIESVNQIQVPQKEQRPDKHKFKFELNFYNKKFDAKTQKKLTIFGYEDLSGEVASGEEAISKHMTALA